MEEEDDFQEQDLSDATDDDIRRMVADEPAPQQEEARAPEPYPEPADLSDDDIKRIVDEEPPPDESQPKPPPQPEGAPESEGTVVSGGREALHAAAPGVAGAAGLGYGAMAGAALGSAVPVVGTVAGGLIGGILGGLGAGTAASLAQEWLLKKFGFDDEAQRAANLAEHPIATGVGTVAGMLPSFGVAGGLNLGVRAAGAAIGGGIDYAMTGDPLHALGVAGASAALNKPTALGAGAIRAGESAAEASGISAAGPKLSSLLAERVQEVSNDAQAPAPEGSSTKYGENRPGFPGEAPSPAAEVHRTDVETPGTSTPGGPPGNATSATPPLRGEGIVSEQQNQPTRTGPGPEEAGKGKTSVEQGGGQEPTQLGSIAADVRAALGREEEPPAAPVRQQAQQEQPDAPVPGWMQANRDQAIAQYKGTPVEKTIGEMARAGKTAAEIEAATGVDKDTVRILRDNMGIEAAGPKEGFLTQPGQNKPNIEQLMREQGVEPRRPGEPLKTATPEEINARMKAQGIPPEGADLVQQLKETQAKRATQVAAERNAETLKSANPEIDAATQRAIEAAQPYRAQQKAQKQTTLKVGEAPEQQKAGPGGPGGPPREPPGGPPGGREPPEPGPKASRLDKPPLLASAPEGGVFQRAGNTLRRLFAPEFMSPASEKAGEAIRRGRGQLQKLNDEWTGRMKKYYPEIEKLDKFGKDALTDRLEGGTAERFKDWKIPEALKPLLKENEEHNAAYKAVIARLAKDPEHAEAVKAWQEQHLTHIYKNPEAEYQGGGGGIRGSGGSLKERRYETYEQAKQEAGHERAHENPLDSQAAYRASLGDFLALRQAVQEMRASGNLKYATPEASVGASGQGSSLKARIHKDWEPVPGLEIQGRVAYMPRDAANIFRNHLMPDFSPNKDFATLERIWREGGNRASQMALGIWNGFHSFVVSTESMFSQVARGAGEATTSLLKGDTAGAMRGLKDIGTAPAAPAKHYLIGRQAQGAVTGNESRLASSLEKQGVIRQLDETDHAIIKHAYDAGYMPMGRSHAPDVNMTGAMDYYEAWMKGQFGRMMYESAQRIKDNPLRNVPIEAWDHMGRVLQTLSRPLFQHYIPALKFGALIDNARVAVRQGKWDLKTPEGQEKLTAFLRKESNVIDNRMGEMNVKNVFLNKAISRAGYGSMLSFSWMLGSARAVGGGMMSALKSGIKDISSLARGKFEGSEFANKLDMTHKDYDPNVAYALTFPIGAALMGAAYTYMRTGEMPKDWRDLYFPRTGGKIPGLGGKGQVDERIMLPGYHKEFFGWTEKGLGEAYSKLNPAIQAGVEELQNRDWRNLPIVRPNATLAESAADRAGHVLGKVGPLAVKTQMEVPKEGTALSRGERMLGFRPTGMQHTDPEALKNYLNAKYKKEWETKQRSEARAAHGGVNPPKEKKSRSTLVRP